MHGDLNMWNCAQRGGDIAAVVSFSSFPNVRLLLAVFWLQHAVNIPGLVGQNSCPVAFFSEIMRKFVNFFCAQVFNLQSSPSRMMQTVAQYVSFLSRRICKNHTCNVVVKSYSFKFISLGFRFSKIRFFRVFLINA